jgi:fumarate hydratase class II
MVIVNPQRLKRHTMVTAMKSTFRIEHDSLGAVEVPADRLWGAQTERARTHFAVGAEQFRWSRPVIRALGVVKKSAALANGELKELSSQKADLIATAAQEVIDGKWDAEFPLGVFQSGSGTQTNMNANEVIANLAGDSVHPNDDVNRGQSTNDVFPTAMHIAAVDQIGKDLLPAVRVLQNTLLAKSEAWRDVVMIGRTHLQDAAPLTLGQVTSGWAAQLQISIESVGRCLPDLFELAIGGTAVGTGLNAHPHFSEVCAKRIATETGQPFVPARNKFAALSGHEAMVNLSASLRTLATALMKIANDVRWYASGPRAGIGELLIPENEPGSSIMPGKINPTQCEVMTQVAVQVFGNDHAVAFAASQGNFQLNVFKPVILHNVLESIGLISEACHSFEKYCASGIEPNLRTIRLHLEASLMLVTALNPHIGYERAAEIALMAHHEGISLREAALKSRHVTAEQFDQWVRPENMLGPS